MERLTFRTIAYWKTGYGTCLMSQLPAILIIIWWWQRLGKDSQWVSKRQIIWFWGIRSGGAKRGISLKCQMFPGLKTREGRQKIWEWISEWQLKTICLTLDTDFLVKTTESKRLPQLFWVHLAIRATFSASSVALMRFGTISEGYYHRCYFPGFFHRLLFPLRFGTLSKYCRALIFEAGKNDPFQYWHF